MSPLSVPNFSPIGARIRVLWRILQSVRKEVEEEKNEEKKPKLWPLVSRKWLELGLGGIRVSLHDISCRNISRYYYLSRLLKMTAILE